MLKKLFGNKLRIAIVIVILLVAGYFGYKQFFNKSTQPTYQTTQAEKGTLVKTVSASGTITLGNSVSITTNATGLVSQVYVKNGDSVTQGQKIADLTLDLDSQAKQASAWSSYLQAKTSLDSANAKFNSLQAAEFTANQKLINDAVARNLKSDDPTYIEENASWLQSEADYKNQTAIVTQSQAAVSSAWLSYEESSPIITAPISGVINNLTLTPGLSIKPSTTSSTSTNTSQKFGSISLDAGQIQATVNVAEVDAPNIVPGQKVTLTLDAFADKTFTGKVLTIDTNGSVSSGVTTYPATISLDSGEANIYPNMAVSAKIITSVKDNVLLVPSAAVSTSNNQSTPTGSGSSVRVLKNGSVNSVDVTIGDSNDTQTEITSGINEGDSVVTGQTSISSRRSTTQTSPFSVFGGRGGGGGGRGVFIGR
ncbi:efflux RND transporter periplasmic adaptor subunit [Candidatus Daviesbacteria bacterium]|nr:efflux RND transporter periplasmic adaptor subunit [Candidatus Daviesbacteria bacterium]